MTDSELAARLDQSVLRPGTRARDIDEACEAALKHRFRGLCVPGRFVAQAVARLAGSGVLVVSVAGFPHGTQHPSVKAQEAARAALDGAGEVDYVISVGAALDGDFAALRAEAGEIVAAAGGRPVKAILETALLDLHQRFDVAEALSETGVSFVKTSTGFGPGGATVEDVRLLDRAAAGRVRVKASGGVRTREEAVALLEAGADVVGTSRGPEMCAGTASGGGQP